MECQRDVLKGIFRLETRGATEFAAARRNRRMPHLPSRIAAAGFDVGAVSIVAVCQALQNAVIARLFPHAGGNRSDVGTAVFVHAADGRDSYSYPHRRANRYARCTDLPLGFVSRGAHSMDFRLVAYVFAGFGL